MSLKLKVSFLGIVAALFAAPGAQAVTDTASILSRAVVYNWGGVVRWQALCPLVSGVTRQQGNQILDHVLAIAHESGVPLGGEKCVPNLYILLTTDPEQLLEGMQKRNTAFTFGCGIKDPFTQPSLIEDFIHTPRIVRTWYNTLPTYPGWSAKRECAYRRLNGLPPTNLLTAFVVIDTTRLPGIAPEQLADYIAMVSLVPVNPDGPVREGETILRLFDGPPGSAPTGITVWDRALLKIVYAGSKWLIGPTDNGTKYQQGFRRRIIAKVEHP